MKSYSNLINRGTEETLESVCINNRVSLLSISYYLSEKTPKY